MERILHITLKRKWFLMIEEGIKLHEYREIKPYWCRRFCGKEWYKYELEVLEQAINVHPDIISANNGYAKDCPNVKWRHKGIRIGKPNPAWCEPSDVDKTVFILEIGELIK